MSQAGEGSRNPESGKGARMGRDTLVAVARRSPRHSSLFWFLFDQHDQLIEAKKLSGLGIPWNPCCRAVRRSKPDALEGKSRYAQGRPPDVFARAEEEGATCRAGSRGGEPSARSSARVILGRICPRASPDRSPRRCRSSTASGRCAPAASAAAYCGGGRERTHRHAWRTGADGRAGGTASGRGLHHHVRE